MIMRIALASSLAASLVVFGTALAAPPETKSDIKPDTTYRTDASINSDAKNSESKSSDAAIASKVKAALIDNETTKARQINVEVYKGQVQLNGFVDNADQKMAAGQVAGQVAGVMNVKNNLEVQQGERTAGQAINDGMLTAKVKAALIGDSRTKAHQIEVNTREGVVQLGGFVDNAAAKSAAAEVAGSIDGVKSVQNKLNVRN